MKLGVLFRGKSGTIVPATITKMEEVEGEAMVHAKFTGDVEIVTTPEDERFIQASDRKKISTKDAKEYLKTAGLLSDESELEEEESD